MKSPLFSAVAVLATCSYASAESAPAPERPSLVESAASAFRMASPEPEGATKADEDEKSSPEKAAPDDDTELAKKLSNPIADLISIPFQSNYDKAYGPNRAGTYKLNIQPVIPIHINKDWNVITRTIVPVISADSPAPGVESAAGLGDTLQSFFLSPRDPIDGWILGAGPVFNWPTATSVELGTGKWGIGPTAVALKQQNGWTYGALVNHVWSYAGQSDRSEVNSTYLQPFLTYTWKTATTAILNTESTYDWVTHQWTVPINADIAQIFRLGKLPVQVMVGGRYYAETPPGGARWGIRVNITFLLPAGN